MTMADRIKERRKAMDLTQEELAERLGLQKSAIAKYENGRVHNLKRPIIAEMAKVLNCSPAYLMGWDSPEPTASASRPHSPDEASLLDDYQKLNELGREKARDYVGDLTEQKKYTDRVSDE